MVQWESHKSSGQQGLLCDLWQILSFCNPVFPSLKNGDNNAYR